MNVQDVLTRIHKCVPTGKCAHINTLSTKLLIFSYFIC